MGLGALFRKTPAEVQLELEPEGRRLRIPSDRSILQAALEQGLDLPHSCRVGSCGTCKRRLLDGRVKELTDKAYTLSAEEIDQGYILICQSRALSDLRLAGGASSPAGSARIVSVRSLTHDILELTVESDQAMRYRAGQYANVRRGQMKRWRSYSFAAPPSPDGDRLLSFHVRLVPGGEFTDWLFGGDRVGEALELQGPLGDFYLRPGPGPILCVAGGSGMAPIRSLLLDALRQGVQRPALFLFGAREERDLYCVEEMDALAKQWAAPFRFLPVLSAEKEGSDWSGRRGFVSDYIPREFDDFASAEAYLCGPPAMIDSAIETLHRCGVDDGRIFFDRFTDARDLISSGAAQSV